MNQAYLDTARLLTQIAPFVFAESTFALKGGTAINLFVRDMPRLSVDLDLVFTDHHQSRDAALARIRDSLRQSTERLNARGFQTHAPASADAGETKLLVRRGNIEVKVEVNYVIRGTVLPVRPLQSLSRPRQAHAVRHWLKASFGVVPSTAQLQELLDQVAACTTRGHRVQLKVGQGFVQGSRQGLTWYNP